MKRQVKIWVSVAEAFAVTLFLMLALCYCKPDKKEMRRQMDKGLEFFYDGKYKEAIAIFDKLILEDSTQYDVYFFRGSSWFNLKEVNKALADFNKAISLNPRFANAYSTRGDIYSYLGKKEEACKDYTLANNLGKPNMRDKLRFCP